MVPLRLAEQGAHEAIMEVNDLVDECGACVEDYRDQRRVTADRFLVTQMLSRHLPALAGELQQAVLVDGLFQPIRQPQFA